MRVWFNNRMRPCQGRENGAIPFTRSISIGSVAHQQRCLRTATIQMREAQRAARRWPSARTSHHFRGHSSVSRADASHASGRRRESFCPHHLSLWCSSDNTPASHAGDHRSEAGQGRHFPARGSQGIADPPDSESGSLGRALQFAKANRSIWGNLIARLGKSTRLAPTISPSKYCQRCIRSVSESARCNSE